MTNDSVPWVPLLFLAVPVCFPILVPVVSLPPQNSHGGQWRKPK